MSKKRYWLIAERVRNEMTQNEAAKKIGISQPTLSLIEKGDHLPQVSTAMKIGSTLGFDFMRFYQEE